MGSSRSNRRPEEEVRQRLIHYMNEKCGFPKSAIAVEKSLKELPYLSHISNPRRIDIVCFAKGIHPDHPLSPLLLVECKAGAISEAAVTQAFGYNAEVKAPFILLAGPKELRLYFPNGDGKIDYLPHLLSYQELVSRAKGLHGG